MKRKENVIYTIQNEQGDEGFIQFIDLDDMTEHHKVTEEVFQFYPEHAHQHNVISKKQHDDILQLHIAHRINGDDDDIWDRLCKLIDETVKQSATFQLKLPTI